MTTTLTRTDPSAREIRGKLADGPLAVAGMTPDCIGVAVFRPSHFASSKLMELVFDEKKLPPYLFDEDLDLSRIEEFVVWHTSSAGPNDLPLLRFGVRYRKPVDEAEGLRWLRVRSLSWQADERTFLFGPRTEIQSMLGEKKPASAISERLMALPQDHDLIGVFHFDGRDPTEPLEKVAWNSPGDRDEAKTLVKTLEPYRTLAKNTTWCEVVADLSSPDWFQLRTESRTATDAAVAKEIIDGRLEVWKAALAAHAVYHVAVPFLKSTSVTQSDSRIEVKLTPARDLIRNTADVMKPAIRSARETSYHSYRKYYLNHIYMAFLNYQVSGGGEFAPARRPRTAKAPNLSWRVHLLPFLDEAALYSRFHFDEPWDSEHNRKLLDRMPAPFRVRGIDDPTKTSIMVFAGKGTPFPDGFGISPQQFRDGIDKTLLVVEAGPDKAVPWTKPEELELDESDPWKSLGKISDEGLWALFASGRVERIATTTSDKDLKAMITPAAGDNK